VRLRPGAEGLELTFTGSFTAADLAAVKAIPGRWDPADRATVIKWPARHPCSQIIPLAPQRMRQHIRQRIAAPVCSAVRASCTAPISSGLAVAEPRSMCARKGNGEAPITSYLKSSAERNAAQGSLAVRIWVDASA